MQRNQRMQDFTTITAGTDLTSLGGLAARTAVELANVFDARRVHLTYVASPVPSWFVGASEVSAASTATAFESNLNAARSSMERLRLPATKAKVTREVRVGAAARELALSASEIGADLTVVASDNRGSLGRFVLGSVSSALLRVSPCPVFVVGDDRRLRDRVQNVVAAVDGSPVSTRVIENAIKFARRARGKVKIVSVLDVTPFGPPEGPTIERIKAQHRAQITALAKRFETPGVELEICIRSDNNPRETILSIAEEWGTDLLAIGTSGHGAWERMLLGSTATRLLAEAPSPLLVVPARRDTDKLFFEN